MSSDMVGSEIGCLHVVSHSIETSKRNPKFVVKCLVCGEVFEMLAGNIRRHGKSTPKGCKHCYKWNKKHGLWNDPRYKIYDGMMRRCYSEKHQRYKDYGGRGITVCDEWKGSPEVFCEWLAKNGWRKGLQIDREDNDIGYNPYNTRIVTASVNANNRRNNRHVYIDGVKLTISQAFKMTGIKKTTIKERLNRGWSVCDAATKPVNQNNGNKRSCERPLEGNF